MTFTAWVFYMGQILWFVCFNMVLECLFVIILFQLDLHSLRKLTSSAKNLDVKKAILALYHKGLPCSQFVSKMNEFRFAQLNIDFSEKVFCFSIYETIINFCLWYKFFEISILSPAKWPKVVLRHMPHPVHTYVDLPSHANSLKKNISRQNYLSKSM